MGRKKKEKPLVLDVDKKKRPPRTHSEATKKLISERRRARTQQPRHAGQSNKRLTFYAELKHEYDSIGDKKMSEKKKRELQDAREWIENNKVELGHVDNVTDFRQLLPDYEKWGVLTEYREMYHKNYEEKVGDILYSDERTPANEVSNDPFDIVSDSMSDSDYREIFGGDFDE